MKGLTLFWKVCLHGLGLVTFVALAMYVAHEFSPDDAGWRDLHVGIAAHLAEETTPLASDPFALRRELERFRATLGVDLSVYAIDGTLLASNVVPPLEPLKDDVLGHLAKGPHGQRSMRWYVVAPLSRAGAPFAYLVLQDAAHPELENDARHATMLALVLIALALGSIPLAAVITRPLERLTKAARAFGRGDFSARSGIDRRDEVGQLARAFDEMATRIERLIIGEKELLANVSHELRTPLARIRVALDIAAEGDLDRARATISEIGVDLDELDAIIGDLLTAARLELGAKAAPLRRARMAFSEVIDHSASRFRSMHPDRELSISIEGSAEIDADLGLLRRAVDNVLDNARKYSDQAIIVSARAENAQVMIDVGDRGIGIDEADLPHIFTPFFRTDRSRARSGGGVGLGLMLARRIVEAHGGQIGIESAPGVGTTVHISVPRA